MKKKALIPKTQSQLPLKNANRLIVKDGEDIVVENASASDHQDSKFKVE